MLHDGVQCRLSPKLGYRMADGKTDVDINGDVVKTNYIVLVNIKDCPVEENNGHLYYNPDGAKQAVLIDHGGTYYGYGKSKKVLNGTGKYVRILVDGVLSAQRELRFSYWKTPYYCVRDGKVYRGNCYKEIRENAQ